MKKVFLILLTIVLTGSLIWGGYTNSASVQVIKLRYNTQQPDIIWDQVHGAKPWLREVEKATGGKVHEFERRESWKIN